MKPWLIPLLFSFCGNLTGLYCEKAVPHKFTCDTTTRAELANTLSDPQALVLRDVILGNTFPQFKLRRGTNHTTSCKRRFQSLARLAKWNTNSVLDFVLQYYQTDILALPVLQRELSWRGIANRDYRNVQIFVDLNDRKFEVATSKEYIKGKTLTSAAREARPSTFLTLNKEGTEITHIRGECVAVMDVLKKSLDFNYTVKPAFEAAGLINGTWNGIMGMLVRKEIDFSMQPFQLDAERFAAVEYSLFTFGAPFTLLVPYPTEIHSLLASTWPFEPQVWLWLFFTIVLVTIGIVVVVMVRGQDTPVMQLVFETFTFTYGVLVCQGKDCPGRNHEVRLIAGAWGLATVIFVYTYNSQLTSFLTVPQLSSVVNSIDELVHTKQVDFIIMSGNGYLSDYLNATSGSYKVIGDRIRSNPQRHLATSFDNAINKVASGKYAFALNAYTGTYYGNLLFQKTRTCSVTLAKQSTHFPFSHYLLQKNSPYLAAINSKLSQIVDYGIADYVIKHSSGGLPHFQDYCKIPVKDVPSTVVLTLIQLQTAYAVLGIGLTAALLAFAVELTFKYLGKG